MNSEATVTDIRNRLLELIHHFEHVLPSQGPIRDFVHHNTLHGYQHLPFDQALTASRKLTGAQGYLPETRFRAYFEQGRITRDDLADALDNVEFARASEALPNTNLLRRDVLLPSLIHEFGRLSRTQLKWHIEELHALDRFQLTADQAARERLLATSGANEAAALNDLWIACLESLGLEQELRHPEDLLDPRPEYVEAMKAEIAAEIQQEESDQVTTRLIHKNASTLLDHVLEQVGSKWTLRGLLQVLTGEDILDDVRPLLIRHLASHLDQGMAAWHNPMRAQGFYAAWKASSQNDLTWPLNDMSDSQTFFDRLQDDPLDTIIQELRLIGLPEDRWEGYLERLALELPGWSGQTLWRHNHPGYSGLTTPVNMLDYLAVRLALEHLYAHRLCRRYWRIEASLSGLRWHFRHLPAELMVRHALYEGSLPEYLISFSEQLTRESPDRKENTRNKGWNIMAQLLWSWRQTPSGDRRADASVGGSAWPLYCLCQHLGLAAPDVRRMGHEGISALLETLNLLEPDQRGHVWLLAYERHYREQIFTALAANHNRGSWLTRESRPEAQLVFCMDDREEGTRRLLEEINPRLETLGAAAHFGIFMNWRGLDDTTVTPLCPIVPAVIIPSHEIREVEQSGLELQRAKHNNRHQRRMRWAKILHHETRRGLIFPSLLTAVAAPATLALLAGKLLAPSAIAGLSKILVSVFDGKIATQIALNAPNDSPAATPESPRMGFTDAEQAERVFNFLRAIGLTSGFSPLVVISGHGSNSQNNPHLSAYDCGACSGNHSGPNARVFAAICNRQEIRALLADRGIIIPQDSWFIGAEHNTCDDIVTWYDLDRIPSSLKSAYTKLAAEVDQATRQHAQERCRRFASAPDNPSLKTAWRHIQNRRYDFSQARPELGHATNACAFIGRRAISQGAFFDRRSFLISYDPNNDPEGLILERHLLINGPVGAGISLEYYFSMVDNEVYGCSTKIMHNVSGLLGVMEGTSSDLRTGLPIQMIEIHEAMRLLVVVEAKIDLITAIYMRQPALQELVGNRWVIVAAKDPDSEAIHLFDPAKGWLPWSGKTSLPTVNCSYDWFNGKRDPLPPVLITKPMAQEISA